MIEHHHVSEFGSTNSIDDILELVAQEAGVEKAIKLAELLEVEPPVSLKKQIDATALPRPNRSYSG
jgi:hypothetical protein